MHLGILRKLLIECLEMLEWSCNIIQSMYRNARSRAKVSVTFNNDFLIQVGLHQGSVLSPLLFAIVREVIFRLKELFYAHDLVSETLEGLKGRSAAWEGGWSQKA